MIEMAQLSANIMSVNKYETIGRNPHTAFVKSWKSLLSVATLIPNPARNTVITHNQHNQIWNIAPLMCFESMYLRMKEQPFSIEHVCVADMQSPHASAWCFCCACICAKGASGNCKERDFIGGWDVVSQISICCAKWTS